MRNLFLWVATILAGILVGIIAFAPNVEIRRIQVPVSAPARAACPSAFQGNGAMGACAPRVQVEQSQTATVAFAATAAVTFPDFSNNDPCVCGSKIKENGHPGAIVKMSQGVYYRDETAAPMVANFKKNGLAVGGYLFDAEYTVAEAEVFVSQLHRAGIYKNTPNTFPPVLDVEYGNANRAGLQSQIDYLDRIFGRVMVYTGGWFWVPHFGSWIPSGVSYWLAGYPNASALPGLSDGWYVAHQFTDHGWFGDGFADLSLWLWSRLAFDRFVHKPLTVTQKEIVSTAAVGVSIQRTLRQERTACKAGHAGACSRARTRVRTLRRVYWRKRYAEHRITIVRAERRKVLRLIGVHKCLWKRKHHRRLGARCRAWIVAAGRLNRQVRSLERVR